MWAGDRCPHCGCPLEHGDRAADPDRPGAVEAVDEVEAVNPDDVADVGDVTMDRSIELLQAEVVELRATVARLRGSGFTGVASTGTGRH